jgi:hypothetical protein
MKNGYLGRLIARAVSAPPRVSTPAPVADPFETTEPLPLTLPPASSPAFSLADPGEPPRETSLEPSPRLESPALQPPRIIEQTTFIENAAIMGPAMQAGPPESASPTATPRAVTQRPEEIERVIDDRERPIAPMTAPILPRGPEPDFEAAPEFRSETIVEHETTTRVVEREVVSLQPNATQPVAESLATNMEAPALIVQPQAAPVLETIRAPAEPTSLSIGRLIVDVVPTPRPAPAPQSNRGTRRASRVPSSASHFFGLGQI